MDSHPEMGFKPVVTPFGIIRQPTADECRLVGRDTSYSEPFVPVRGDYRDLGDYVIAIDTAADTVVLLAQVCEELAIGDDVHIIPAGIYIEE